MGTIKAGAIVSRAQLALIDETEIRWTQSELLEYLSDGQREAVILKPSTNPRNEVVQLDPGTKQVIPAGGMSLIEPVRMMGSDGETPGRALRQISREVLDRTRPDWHSADPDEVGLHWMFDDRDPATWYIDPPQPDPGYYAEIIYSKVPDEIDDANTEIELSDAYQTPLFYYLMHRAMAKDSGQADPNKAVAYYQQFLGIIQGDAEARMRMHPDALQRRAER